MNPLGQEQSCLLQSSGSLHPQVPDASQSSGCGCSEPVGTHVPVILHGESLWQVRVVQVLGLGRCVSACARRCAFQKSPGSRHRQGWCIYWRSSLLLLAASMRSSWHCDHF